MEQLKVAHSIRIEKNILTATGVLGVDEYDNKEVRVRLEGRGLIIKGENLDIKDLDTAEQKLSISGSVISVTYTGSTEKVPLLKRLLK